MNSDLVKGKLEGSSSFFAGSRDKNIEMTTDTKDDVSIHSASTGFPDAGSNSYKGADDEDYKSSRDGSHVRQ